MLWERSLVMRDEETGSLWSHLLGRCMQGPLEGAELEALPSVMTDWKTWRAEHPDTTVLMMSRTSVNFRREIYREPSRFVVGMAEGETARAWPFDQLVRRPVVNDQFSARPVLIVFDRPSGTAFIYDRTVGSRTLSFTLRDGSLVDEQTESRWSAARGEAIDGPLRGTRLAPLVGIVSFRRAWDTFHPDSQYWSAED